MVLQKYGVYIQAPVYPNEVTCPPESQGINSFFPWLGSFTPCWRGMSGDHQLPIRSPVHNPVVWLGELCCVGYTRLKGFPHDFPGEGPFLGAPALPPGWLGPSEWPLRWRLSAPQTLSSSLAGHPGASQGRPPAVRRNPFPYNLCRDRLPRSAREIIDATAAVHRGCRERGGIAGGGIGFGPTRRIAPDTRV